MKYESKGKRELWRISLDIPSTQRPSAKAPKGSARLGSPIPSTILLWPTWPCGMDLRSLCPSSFYRCSRVFWWLLRAPRSYHSELKCMESGRDASYKHLHCFEISKRGPEPRLVSRNPRRRLLGSTNLGRLLLGDMNPRRLLSHSALKSLPVPLLGLR